MDEIIDPGLPIIDPHHHLWDYRAVLDRLPTALHPFFDNFRCHPLYGLDELAADIGSGHNVVATVYVEAHTGYRSNVRPISPIERRPSCPSCTVTPSEDFRKTVVSQVGDFGRAEVWSHREQRLRGRG